MIFGFSRWSSCLAVVLTLVFSAIVPAMARPNVLFIAVDDLRPELGCYGKEAIHSPHIDSLAAGGVVFERAYCMVPTCGASRASLMTGLRPSRNRFVNYLAWAEKDAPSVVTLNTHFRRNGYHTVSLGKIFHHPQDNVEGWSEKPWRPVRRQIYALPENQAIQRANRSKTNKPNRGPAVESADVPDNTYADGRLAEQAVATLQRLSEKEEPFFLAVGFFKPHLPFIAPQRYWDLYPRDEISVPRNYHPPENAPSGAVHAFGELRAYHGIPNQGILSEEQARELIHGYYACVSYTDAQIGKVLQALDRWGLSEETIVVLWGDHGWNLGEHTMWCKHSTFESSMHAPLIVRAPGFLAGAKTAALTEFIDLYPSLCELAGLPLPAHLQGRSFVPLLREPDLRWKTAAIGRYRNGDTIRTDRFRFTQYWNTDLTPRSRMLYDHTRDPGEDANVEAFPEYGEPAQRLTRELMRRMGLPNP